MYLYSPHAWGWTVVRELDGVLRERIPHMRGDGPYVEIWGYYRIIFNYSSYSTINVRIADQYPFSPIELIALTRQ